MKNESLASAHAGTGLLAYPYGLLVSGWIGIGILVLLAAACRYTASLLGQITHAFPHANEYASMAQAAFGTPGTITMATIFAFELLVAAAAAFAVLAGDSLAALFPDSSLGVSGFAILFVAIVVPTLAIPDLTYLSGVSFIGLLSSVIAVTAVVYTGVTLDGSAGGIVPPADTRVGRLDPKAYMWVLGLFMVGFAGHACFPAIRASMAKPQHYESMLNWVFGMTVAVYAGVSSIGYLMYGDQLKAEITLNLPQDAIVTKIALWLIVVNVWSKFAISLEPIADVADGVGIWLWTTCCGSAFDDGTEPGPEDEAEGLLAGTSSPSSPLSLCPSAERRLDFDHIVIDPKKACDFGGAVSSTKDQRRVPIAAVVAPSVTSNVLEPLAVVPLPAHDGSVASHVARATSRHQARRARRTGAVVCSADPAVLASEASRASSQRRKHAARLPDAEASYIAGDGHDTRFDTCALSSLLELTESPLLTVVAVRNTSNIANGPALQAPASNAPLRAEPRVSATSPNASPLWSAGRMIQHPLLGRSPAAAAAAHSSSSSSSFCTSTTGCCGAPCCCGVTRAEWAKRTLVRTCLAGTALGIALSLPQFQRILALSGAVASFTVSIAAPPAFYAVLFADKLSTCAFVFNWSLAIGGLILAITGTVGAIIGPF